MKVLLNVNQATDHGNAFTWLSDRACHLGNMKPFIN